MNQFDGLPLGICNSCTFQLGNCHSFRQQCIQSVEVLIALKLSGVEEKKIFGTEVRHSLARFPNAHSLLMPFFPQQYAVEEAHYVEWKDEEDTADDEEAALQKVSSHLHIEPIAYADDDDDENVPIAVKKSAKRPRKPYTRRTYKVEEELETSGTGPEMDGGDDHHDYDDVDEINEQVVVPRIKNEYNDVKLPTTVAAVVTKKMPAGRKPRGQKSEPKAAKLPKMEQCEVCGFISRSLKTHMLTHTNEKRYECDFCGKKFALRSSMKNHLFAHVNIR